MTENKNTADQSLAEARSLGRELARVYNRLIDGAMQLHNIPHEEARREIDCLLSTTSLEDVLAKDVEEISWIDLDSLASDGESHEAWELMKRAALEEAETGISAAKVIEGYGAEPWQRAEFFAMRKGMMDEWKPKGGIEMALLDTLASSLWMYRFWLHQHVIRATTRAEIQQSDLKKRGKRRPEFSWEIEDTARAAEMADRFHRMAMRTLRALRDVRRYSPAVNIRNAGQVNIGEKQVNVSD